MNIFAVFVVIIAINKLLSIKGLFGPSTASPFNYRQLERSGASAVVGSRNLILMPRGQWIRASDSAAHISCWG